MFVQPYGEWQYAHTLFDAAGEHTFTSHITHASDGTLTHSIDRPSADGGPLGLLMGDYHHHLAGGVFKGHDLQGTTVHTGQHLTSIHGLMTRLGYYVTTDQISPTPDLTLAFSTFSSGLQHVAYLLSVGASDHQPVWSGPRWAAAVAPRWRGTLEDHTADGDSTQSLTRRTGGLRLDEDTPQGKVITLEMETWAPDAIVSGSVTGLARMLGHALLIEAADGPQNHLHYVELLHPDSEWVVGVRRWYRRQRLQRTEVVRLQPA